jgi:hypothetical protein
MWAVWENASELLKDFPKFRRYMQITWLGSRDSTVAALHPYDIWHRRYEVLYNDTNMAVET